MLISRQGKPDWNLQTGTQLELYKYFFRDWSLITGRGGGGSTKLDRGGGGGHAKFYPYEKGGGNSFSHAGGHTKFWGIFYAVA